nr:syncytin-1-like isoform X2 [Aotus nancymaae]
MSSEAAEPELSKSREETTREPAAVSPSGHEDADSCRPSDRSLPWNPCRLRRYIRHQPEVVLQNRRGLDLLTAEKGGICLALGEKCCFYVNQSGIVSDKIKALQEDLARRRKALADNPLWGGWNGLLPYVLPLLGPLLGLLLLLSIGPVIFNKVMAFIRTQIEAIKMQPLQVPYHKLEMAERELEMGLRNNGTISTAYRL